MTARALLTTLTAALILAAAGCAGPAANAPANGTTSTVAPASPALPPRPTTLTMGQTNPCDLLTEAQRQQYGVGAGQPDTTDFGGPNKGPGCTWSSLRMDPDYGYGTVFVLNRGVDAVHSKEPPRSIDGFGAVTTGTIGTDPNYYCQIFVDVAPNQAFSVSFDNNGKDVPGMNHQIACDKAQQAAELMLSNFRAATHQ
jgi:hypothetical protein